MADKGADGFPADYTEAEKEEYRRDFGERREHADRYSDNVKEEAHEDISKNAKRYDWMPDDDKNDGYDSKRYDWAKDTDFNHKRESIISQDIRKIKNVASRVKGVADRANHKYGPALHNLKRNVARDVSVKPRVDRSRAPMTQRRGRSIGQVKGRGPYLGGTNPIGFGAPVDQPGQYRAYPQQSRHDSYQPPASMPFNFDFVLGNPQVQQSQKRPQQKQPQYHGPTFQPPTAGFDFNPNFIFSHIPQPKMTHGLNGNGNTHKRKKSRNGKKHR